MGSAPFLGGAAQAAQQPDGEPRQRVCRLAGQRAQHRGSPGNISLSLSPSLTRALHDRESYVLPHLSCAVCTPKLHTTYLSVSCCCIAARSLAPILDLNLRPQQHAQMLLRA